MYGCVATPARFASGTVGGALGMVMRVSSTLGSLPTSDRRTEYGMKTRAAVLDEGAKAFVKSWHELMEVIVSKSADLGKAG